LRINIDLRRRDPGGTLKVNAPQVRTGSTEEHHEESLEIRRPAGRGLQRRVALQRSAGGGRSASGPQVSKAVAKPLKAAQEALAGKKLDEALAHVREAQGAAGDKTPYDNYVMNIMLFQIYQQKQDMADAIPVLLQAAQSQYAAPISRSYGSRTSHCITSSRRTLPRHWMLPTRPSSTASTTSIPSG